MSVGRRVKHLIDSHGHSLRQAAALTGQSYETIRRIINGYEGPTLVYNVTKIANGYKVSPKSLLEGLDPKGDFEFSIQQGSAYQRLDMMAMSPQERLRLTLDFLQARYRSVSTVDVLAAVSGMENSELESILSDWESRQPDLTTTLAIARGIHRLTRISMSWFVCGRLEQESGSKPFVERCCQLLVQATKGSKKHSAGRTQALLQVVEATVAG